MKKNQNSFLEKMNNIDLEYANKTYLPCFEYEFTAVLKLRLKVFTLGICETRVVAPWLDLGIRE